MAKLTVSGSVEGVDFTKSGSLKNSDGDLITFSSSVKLQLSTLVKVEKQGIITTSKRMFKVNIPVEDDQIEQEVQKYNKLINHEIECSFIPSESQVFHLNGDVKVIK